MKFKQYLYVVALSASSLAVVNCASSPDAVEEKEQTRYVDTLVGKISSFDQSSGIVLIQTYGTLKSGGTEEVFLTRGDSGMAGNVSLTGQSNKFFVAAEFKSGSMKVGDAVYRRRLNPNFDSKKKAATAENATTKEETVMGKQNVEKPSVPELPPVPETPVVPKEERIPEGKELPPIPIF